MCFLASDLVWLVMVEFVFENMLLHARLIEDSFLAPETSNAVCSAHFGFGVIRF